ncbi:GVIN1-like protein [Mya arenaria]|uniref:GVIN1-like protein n=1 Tax=Mya arenaria TaxID=6604 RepID=A0ABY7ELR6_MYAAR|nr:GVIN1-like protein [Mya arenaria]
MVISTHKKQSAIDVPTLIKNINTGILSLLQDFKKSTSIEKRLCSVCKDVSYPDCEEYCLQLEQGRMMAQDIFKSMLTDIQNTGGKSHSAKNEDRFRNCLTALTPVSHIHSNKLYKNYKDLRAVREYQNDSEETLKEMISTRYEQLNSMTKTTIMFAKYLVYTNKQPLLQHIFIQWLKILIDIEMSQFLPEMIRGQNEVYKRIMRLKNGPDTKEKEQLNKEFVDLEGDISASSLTVDHLLREVSHIYDSILYLNRRCEKYCIPETQDIIRSFTNLMLRTEAIDIVTEYFFMPKYWTNELFKALDTAIPNKDSITIVSVLGLQSTGKSTLLNTMFGQQFKVRGGRCTKGVQARLVSVSDGFDVLPSKYIMVFDSEGFRAPELKTVMNTYDRDNQLATFVSGLGNISIMTVNGENATELTDIIQIVVHASLRLKTANSSIVLGHKCFFVHNNVEEQSEEQMQKGYIEFRKLMDSVAIEAARSEGLGNISSFNDIMQFDERRPFKALPNIWNGDSKIRVFNSKYSKGVADIKSDISLLLENDKYESFRDIATFATDIWDGVITENFVFSFRNSLEMQLYCSTETEINETILKSQIKLQDEFNSRKRKGENDTNVKMLETKAELKESLELLTDLYCSEAKAFVSKLLHTCKYPHIVKQWESQYVKKVEFCYKEMKESIHQDVDRYFFDIQLTTETASIGKKYRDELKSTSMRIAQTMQGKNRNEYDKEFYKHWNTYENDVRKKRDEIFPPLNVCNHFRNLTMKKYSYDANLSKALSVFDRKTAIHSSTQFFVRKISKDDYNLSLTTLFGSQTEMIITHELQEYSKNVERILENLNQTKGPLYENDLQRVFEDIVSKCTDVNTKMKKQGVTLKTSFVTGLVVQTLQYASCMIDSHNETYDKDYGFSASLKRFQMEMYDLFESEITQRRLEEKAARQFCLGIENAVTDIIKDNLTIRASQLLLQELPNIKFNLIKAVSYSLLKAKRFSDFLQYIKLPRDFCCSWYKQECYKVLHSNGKYIELLQHEVENYRRGTERAIPKHVDSSVDVSTWFCNFAKHLTLFTCSKIHFRTFLEIDKLGDFNCFLSFLVDKGLLYETFQRIENNFRSIKDKQGTFTVLYESLFDKCWGCPEVCPFCHEPCMKSKDHGGKHQCLQHRPLGGKGSRWIKSNEIVLNTCNFLVNTMTRRYRCSLVSNKCGCKKTMTECNVYHPYRNYKEFFKNWDIMPSSDPHGCCKFWLWFVGKFAEDLKKHHEYKISEIPDSWFQISDAEALKSLDAYFTVI